MILKMIVAIVPVLFFMYYIYTNDSKKESNSLIIKLILGGIASCFLTLFISDILGCIIPAFKNDINSLSITNKFIHVFLFVALIEEFSKFVFAYRIGFDNREFDETYDAILYCALVSLGFALFENIVYVIVHGVSIGIDRAFTSIPGHLCFGIIMGFNYGMAKIKKINNDNSYRKYLFLAILSPVFIHTVYDFIIYSSIEYSEYIFYGFVFFLYFYIYTRINLYSKRNTYLYNQDNVCPKCNTKQESNFCTNCGTKLK